MKTLLNKNQEHEKRKMNLKNPDAKTAERYSRIGLSDFFV